MRRKPKRGWDWWFIQVCNVVALIAIAGSVQFLIEWNPWKRENLLVTSRSVKYFLQILLNLIVSTIAISFAKTISTTLRLDQLEKGISNLRGKLTAASKHSKTFEIFRSEIEERLMRVEEEQDRWPKMLTDTLAVFTAILLLGMAAIRLGETLIKASQGLPAP